MFFVDASAVYPDVRRFTYDALMRGGEVGLLDLWDAQTWRAILADPFLGELALEAAVAGAAEALTERGITVMPDIAAVSLQETAVRPEHLVAVDRWIQQVMMGTPDEGIASDCPWVGDAGEMSSAVLAVILLGGVATR